LFPGAFLVDEEVTRTEGEFDSRYVQVTRVYETLPGPVVSSQRYNERGELETINTQTVPPSTNPDPDGLLVTQSQVIKEEVSKAVKTTSTVEARATLSGGESKSGLLGKTSLNDEIVAAGTNPDGLTWTGAGGVVESSVQPISATKSQKRTVTTSGPTSLSSTSLVDSPLGLVQANINKSIVSPNQIPSGNVLKIKDTIDRIDETKSEREQVSAVSWPNNVGVNWDEQLGVGVFYTETIIDASSYKNPNIYSDYSYTEVKPIDQWKSLVRTYDKNRIIQALQNQYYRMSTSVPIKLPDKLKRVIVYYGQGYGLGSSSGGGEGASTGSYDQSISSSFKSSWSIGGDVYFEVENGFNGSIDAERHIFFIEAGNDKSVTSSDVIQELRNKSGESYNKWPYLITKTENIVLITGGRSQTQSNSKSESVGLNGFSSSENTSFSYDVDVKAASINVPPTLHGRIDILQSFDGEDPEDKEGVGKPTYGVKPDFLETTKARIDGNEVSAPQFPTGKYLLSADIDVYKYGFVKVTATTVEITGAYT
jgi:hypothetical protein